MSTQRFEQLKTDDLRAVDRICAEFELADRSNRRSIEHFVSGVPDSIQDVLFGELLAIELELNRRDRITLTHDEYLNRFPDRHDQIIAVYQRLEMQDSQDRSAKATALETSTDQNTEEDVPTKIGRFRVEKILGEGGFGIVYKAHDERLDRPVAIKVPRPRFIAQTSSCVAEAKAVARLDHPNIVPVYELGQTNEFPFFLVTKYIDGKSLAESKTQKQKGNAEEAARLVASNLASPHLHLQGHGLRPWLIP